MSESNAVPRIANVLRRVINTFCDHPEGAAFVSETNPATHFIELRVRMTGAEIDAAHGDVESDFGIRRMPFDSITMSGSLAERVAVIRAKGAVAIIAVTACCTHQVSMSARAVPIRRGAERPS